MRWLTLALVLGCTPSHVDLKAEPKDAIEVARKRLVARRVVLDESFKRADALRTAWFCHLPAGRNGLLWDTMMSKAEAGPVGFEREGTLEEQGRVTDRCTHLFRLEVHARPRDSGSRVEVRPEWYRLRQGKCEALGDPLLGNFRCRYDYRGTHQAPDDAAAFLYRTLSGI